MPLKELVGYQFIGISGWREAEYQDIRENPCKNQYVKTKK